MDVCMIWHCRSHWESSRLRFGFNINVRKWLYITESSNRKHKQALTVKFLPFKRCWVARIKSKLRKKVFSKFSNIYDNNTLNISCSKLWLFSYRYRINLQSHWQSLVNGRKKRSWMDTFWSRRTVLTSAINGAKNLAFIPWFQNVLVPKQTNRKHYPQTVTVR